MPARMRNRASPPNPSPRSRPPRTLTREVRPRKTALPTRSPGRRGRSDHPGHASHIRGEGGLDSEALRANRRKGFFSGCNSALPHSRSSIPLQEPAASTRAYLPRQGGGGSWHRASAQRPWLGTFSTRVHMHPYVEQVPTRAACHKD